MLKQLLTLVLVLSAFMVNAQQEFRFEKVLYVHQKDTITHLEFDSLRDVCGRFFIGHSYIEKRIEGSKPSISFLITDRAIKLLVNRYIIYYKCVKLNGELTSPIETNNFYIIYVDEQASTANIGYFKNNVYVIEMYQRKQEP